uniref:F-box domain-containing protein n=1 Tax=Caenorhabditis tropicalis TaxID=1561998 RepID=A0A1I7T1P1_9PELO
MCVAFPLLRLPSVAFREVVRLLDLNTLIKLGLCSERSKRLVKHNHINHHSKKPILTMILNPLSSYITIQYFDEYGSKNLNFMLSDLSLLPRDDIQYWNFKGFCFPVHVASEHLYQTYWVNWITGAKILVPYMTDLLNIRIHELYIKLSYEFSYSMNAVDWAMSCQDSVHSLQVEGRCSDERELNYAMDKCKVTDFLYLNVPTSVSFQRDMNFQLNKIHLVNTPWLTIDNLLQLDCCEIIIERKRFTSKVMNRYLKSWINGGHPKLRKLSVGIEPIRLNVLTEGLDGALVRRQERRQYVVNEKETVWIGDSWDIRGDQVASILGYETEFSPSKTFSMVVWPDFEGNMYDL